MITQAYKSAKTVMDTSSPDISFDKNGVSLLFFISKKFRIVLIYAKKIAKL